MFFKPKGNDSIESDDHLIRLFKKTGDLEILGALYGKYMHLVYGVCLKYLKDREASQDATMQIFEKLIIELPKREVANFKPWLHVITKNHCLMHLRSEKVRSSRQEKIVAEENYFMENSTILHLNNEQVLEQNLQLLKFCIDRLKDEQKECVKLFYIEEQCYQEIAENLKIDLKKVKSYIQNGKRNLKICMENHGQEA